MSQSRRFLIQSVLWIVIWSLFWVVQDFEIPFLLENIPVYILQIVSVALLIYWLGPIFFKEKLYTKFLLLSFIIVGVGMIIMTSFKLGGPPPPPPVGKLGERLHPPFFKHLTQELFIIFAYLVGLLVEGVHYLQKQEQEATMLKNEALQSELQLLKSQINPHFLFNTLNNIYALAAMDADRTQQSISYLSDMLRYVLYECDRPFVFPKKEVQYIENYIRLFSLKSSKKYPITIESHILDSTVQIAPMLLIPFVENAIKHSHIEKIKEAYITIVLKITKESIWFQIENSVPEKQIHKDKMGGIGLKNVQQRLHIIYPTNHELMISPTENNFKVELTIQPHLSYEGNTIYQVPTEPNWAMNGVPSR